MMIMIIIIIISYIKLKMKSFLLLAIFFTVDLVICCV